MNLINRTGPETFDVILVVALDAAESLGVDISLDLRNLASQGLSIGIICLSQGSSPKRYRNKHLVKTAFELGVRILGHRDVCKTQLAIIYDSDLFVTRAIRGRFVAKRMWIVVGDGQHERLNTTEICARAAEYGVSAPTFMSVTDFSSQSTDPQAPPTRWNFHSSDQGSTEKQLPSRALRGNRIGVPAAVLTRVAISELKSWATQTTSRGEVLCAQVSVPTQLQTGRGEPDYLVGFPFVPVERELFLKSLIMYVVPRAMLDSGAWREDVYACMRFGVPVKLPRVLKPFFGDAALYYDLDPFDVPTDTNEESVKVPERLELARALAEARSYSKSREALRAFGVHAGSSGDAGQHLDGSVPEGVSSAPSEGRKGTRPYRVCFVTSNGAGMGHLTRLLAVARRLDEGIEPTFVSMSQACGVVSKYGFGYEYIPSKGDLLVDGAEWNRYFNVRFMESLNRVNPDVVVFDGTWPYQGVAQAVASYDAKFVWMRRGMWRAETPDTSLVRNTGFDAVIEPGDVASPYDQGPTGRALDAYKVDPIIVLDPSEILDQGSAREALGIAPEEKAMLLTLGAGNINKIDDDVDAVIRAVKGLPEKWRIFMTSPLIADGADVADGVESISVYPLAHYAKAFDFVVSATGYNSFHEWIAYAVPTLWIANAKTVTDDQIGRARYADNVGLGLASGPGGSFSIADAIKHLGNEAAREEIRATMGRIAFTNGAVGAASFISALAEGRSDR